MAGIDRQVKVIAGWGIAVVGILVTAIGSIAKFQWDAIREIQAEQRSSFAQIRTEEASVNTRRDQMLEKITDRLAEVSVNVKTVATTVALIDERGTRHMNEEIEDLRRKVDHNGQKR